MPYLKSTTGKEELNIYYEDLGSGDPVVFIHGWPLSHQMFEYQMTPLRELGFRCIAYDRRGFGKSDQSLNNYSYDAMADDLKNLFEELDLNNVTLIGFSMGGGEVIRYCSKYNCERISRIVLASSIIPYMLKTEDNPDGIPLEVFQDFEKQIRDDRPGFLADFGKQFYGVGFLSKPVSDGILNWTSSLALAASQKAMIDCMVSFSQTDFRKECASINVPTLIIHGDSDKVVPIKAAGEAAAALIKDSEYKIYAGAPHALFYTNKNELNKDIISFITSGKVDMEEMFEGGAAILPSNEPLVTREEGI